jgi:hypothetical protein
MIPFLDDDINHAHCDFSPDNTTHYNPSLILPLSSKNIKTNIPVYFSRRVALFQI